MSDWPAGPMAFRHPVFTPESVRDFLKPVEKAVVEKAKAVWEEDKTIAKAMGAAAFGGAVNAWRDRKDPIKAALGAGLGTGIMLSFGRATRWW